MNGSYVNDNENITPRKDKIHSFSGHFLYSLGAIPSALPYNAIGSYLAFFYEDTMGLLPELFGLLLIIYGIWNAINDPLLGYWMDTKKMKRGRRVPWVLIGNIPLTIGFIFLWVVPATGQLEMFFWAMAMLFIFDFGFTLAISAWGALYTEMYEDERERASVVALKDTIAFISSMVGIILPPLLAGQLTWSGVGATFGLISFATMYLSLKGSRERKEYQTDKPLPFVPAIKETFKNRPFLAITLTYAMIDFSFGLTMLVLPFYSRFILGMPKDMVGFTAIGFALSLLASVPFWRWIYAKKGAKEGLMLAMIIFAIGMVPIFLAQDFLQIILLTLVPGFGAAGMLMTEPAMSAAIDYDELRTGKRREATYNGILTFVARLSLVFNGITLWIIQVSTGFVSGAEAQPPEALLGIKLLISLVPVIGTALGLLCLSFFSLNHARFREMQEQLKVIHEKRRLELEGKRGN